MFRLKYAVIIMHVVTWLICLSLPLLFINGGIIHERLFLKHQAYIRMDVISIFLFLLTITLSIAIEVTRRWSARTQRALYAETRKTQAELSFLKAQMHPHFLFNTLNNIYSLAMSKNEYTAPSILKLSNMLRYITDTSRDYVPLQREIDCIHDYVDLQQLRLSKQTKVRFSVTGNPAFKCIAPLLLLPFLENAFRYGVSTQEPSDIIISLDTTEKGISFFCSNRLFVMPRDTPLHNTDIINTRERLEHLYRDKYQLHIRSDDSGYAVELAVNL